MLNVLMCVYKHNADSINFVYLHPESSIGLKFAVIMDFKPQYYKTNPLSLILRLESVTDRKGNVKFAVTLAKGENDNVHYLFSRLESALDFISSNFG